MVRSPNYSSAKSYCSQRTSFPARLGFPRAAALSTRPAFRPRAVLRMQRADDLRIQAKHARPRLANQARVPQRPFLELRRGSDNSGHLASNGRGLLQTELDEACRQTPRIIRSCGADAKQKRL